MSAEQETKNTEETSVGGNLDAAGSASGAANVGASGSSKKTEERRKPKKLGQKGQANGTPQREEAEGDADAGGDPDGPSSPTPQPQKMEQQSRSKSRQASRGRSRQSSQPPSDTDSAYRSDISQKGGRRNRNRNRGKGQAQAQAQQQGGGGGGGGGPLDAVDEVGETVNGVVDGASDAVDNTVGNVGKAVGKPHEALGGLLHSKGGNDEAEKKDDDGGTDEQLRLRLDLNLDIEVQLKAKIHGDLTLGLLYVSPTSTQVIANDLQELVLDKSWDSYVSDLLFSVSRGIGSPLQKCWSSMVITRSIGRSQIVVKDDHVLGLLCRGVAVSLHFVWLANSVVDVCNNTILINTWTSCSVCRVAISGCRLQLGTTFRYPSHDRRISRP